MANLYEINKQILDCIDLETGEIIETDKFDQLQIEKEEKLESIALWYKNLLAEADAYKAEKNSFADKQKRAESRAESLKKYLDTALNGQKLHTVKVDVTYRRSKSLDYDDGATVPEKYLKHQQPTIDKVGITEAIKSGEVIDGFRLIENQNIQIR